METSLVSKSDVVYSNKMTVHYVLSLFLLTYPVFYPVSNFFGHLGQYSIFAVWLLVSIYQKPDFIVTILKKSWLYLVLYIFTVIRILLSSVEPTSSFASPYRQLTQLFIILVYITFTLWHETYSNTEIKKSLVKGFLIAFLISTIISLFYLSIDPYAIRRPRLNSFIGIGNMNLIATAICISIISFHYILNKKFKFKLIVLLFLSSLLVLRASYMTMIAFLVIMLVITLIYKTPKRTLLGLVLVVFLVLQFRAELAFLIMEVSKFDMWTGVIKLRLNDIADFLLNFTTGNAGTIQDRLIPTFTSLETFVRNPVFGVNYSYYGSMTIGHHTQWIDNLARFGIVGNIVLWFQYVAWYRLFNKNNKTGFTRGPIFICSLFYVLLGFFYNNAYVGIFICICFVANNFNHLFNDTVK